MNGNTIVSSSPHIHHPLRVRSVMLAVITALLPAVAWSVYVFGARAALLTVISAGSCVLFEFLFNLLLKKKQTVSDLSAVVTGLLLAMCLPVSVPLWLPVPGAAFAILIVKMLFGGIGKNVVNPALAARVFLFLSFPALLGTYTAAFDRLPVFSVRPDAVASATPLVALKSGALPETPLFDMVLGNRGGSMGEVSVVLLAAGFLYLLIRGIVNWRIPAAYIGVFAILCLLFPQVGNAGLMYTLYELCSGGLLLGAFFMATDYATSPLTPWGKIIFGAGCGALTFFIRVFGGYPEGASFAILIMNLLVPYLDEWTRPRYVGEKKPEKAKKQEKAGS